MSIDAALGRLGIQTGVCTGSTRPANPYEGQVIFETDTNNLRFWSGSAWESNKGAVISSAAPSSPAAGDIWYDSDDGRAYVYYDDGSSQQWVEFGAPPSGSTIALASYADSAARTTAIPSPTEADLSYLQDTNSVEVYDGSAWTAVGGDLTDIAIFNETQSSGTQGGGYTASAYVKRTLNTTVVNNITGCSLSTSVITLPAGTFEVLVHVPAYKTTLTRTRLYDTTNTTTLAQSSNQIADNGNNGFTLSTVASLFTLTGSTDIEVQMRGNSTQATNGLGAALTTGEDEIYSQITIRKIA